MTKPLYFAPINILGSNSFRKLLLNHKADYVFSEMITISNIDEEIKRGKLDITLEDQNKTIIQIATNTTKQIEEGIKKIIQITPNIKEININMGCPQSTMQKNKICSGILYYPQLMKELTKKLYQECKKQKLIPSVKLRIGTSKEEYKLEEYLKIIKSSKIKKIYIHARPLKYSYEKPAMTQKIINIKEKYPNLQLIYNGDIDSYKKYKQIEPYFDGIMIGRATLYNPLIFEQIKFKIIPKKHKIYFSPTENDPNITQINGITNINQKKVETTLEFIKISKKHHKNIEFMKRNIRYMLKGAKDKETIKKIQSTKDYNKIYNIIKSLKLK